ncbi:hypothetical protein D3C87_390830 [compost metagenome]
MGSNSSPASYAGIFKWCTRSRKASSDRFDECSSWRHFNLNCSAALPLSKLTGIRISGAYRTFFAFNGSSHFKVPSAKNKILTPCSSSKVRASRYMSSRRFCSPLAVSLVCRRVSACRFKTPRASTLSSWAGANSAISSPLALASVLSRSILLAALPGKKLNGRLSDTINRNISLDFSSTTSMVRAVVEERGIFSKRLRAVKSSNSVRARSSFASADRLPCRKSDSKAGETISESFIIASLLHH